MNILVISAHYDQKSFVNSMHNSAIGVLERAGHTVVVSDLYAQNFNPLATTMDFTTKSGAHAEYIFEQQRAVNTGTGFSPDIQSEMDKVKAADMIIFHFPLWWGSPPAILKGWLERVLAMGFAWNSDARYGTGLMKGKTVLVAAAAGDPESFYEPDGMHRASAQQHLYWLLHGTFAFCGFDVLKPYIVFNTTAASSGELEFNITQYRAFIEKIQTEPEYIYKQS